MKKSWLSVILGAAGVAAQAQNGPVSGTVLDATPDYSDRRFEEFERLLKRGEPQQGGDSNFKEAMEQLLPRGPVTNATVTLRTRPGMTRVPDIRLKTVTDAQGDFDFPDVPRGEFVVTVKLPRDWRTGTAESEWLVQHYRTRENVRLECVAAPVTVKGRITDTTGRPLASATITATEPAPDMEGDFTVYLHTASAVSDRDGQYELRGLVPPDAWRAMSLMMGGKAFRDGVYVIRVEADGYAPAQVTIPVLPEDVRRAALRLARIVLERGRADAKEQLAAMENAALPACQGNAIAGIDFTLGLASDVAGQVIDSKHEPLKDGYVSLVPVRGDPGSAPKNAILPRAAGVNGQGAFEFRGVPPGRYTFRIGKDNRWIDADAKPLVVAEGKPATGLQLLYDAQLLGRIEATVCEAETGKPIPQFSASVWSVVNPKEFNSAYGDLLKSVENPGQFSVEKISPGKVELEIKAAGRIPEHVVVDVFPGQTAPLRVRMARAGLARIQITQDGAPVPQLERLQAISMENGVICYGKNGGKEQGWYEIPDLKPGRYAVRAQIFNGKYTRYESAMLAIEAGKPSEAKLDLGGRAGLTLALDFAPEVTAQAWVEAVDAPVGQRIDQNTGLRAYLYAKEPVPYAVEHLQPGTYRVGVRRVNVAKGEKPQDAFVSEQSKTVSLQEGKTAAVRFFAQSDASAKPALE